MKVTPMLQMNGKVMHVFQTPDYTDKETGEVKLGSHKVQLLVNQMLKNGEYKLDVTTLSTDTPEWFEARQGQDIALPVGIFVSGKQAHFYVQKGALVGDNADGSQPFGETTEQNAEKGKKQGDDKGKLLDSLGA